MRTRLSALGILAAAICGCGGDGAPPDPIERALRATQAEPGARIVVRGTERSSSWDGVNRGRCMGRSDGLAADYRCRLGRWRLRAVHWEGVLYVALPREERPERGRRWVRAGSLGFSWERLAAQYAVDLDALARLMRAGELRRTGTEDVRGRRTTRYTSVLEQRVVELLEPPHSVEFGLSSTGPAERNPVQLDFWIDDYDRVRRIRGRLRLETYTDVYGDPPIITLYDVTTEFISFKPQPRIPAPPGVDRARFAR